jgi:hypothetical protein
MDENPYEVPKIPSDRRRLFPWSRALTVSALWTGIWFLIAISLGRAALTSVFFEAAQKIAVVAFFVGVLATVGSYLAKRRQELFFR